MKKTVTNDVIFYTDDNDAKINFSGGDSISIPERWDYLKRYSALLGKWNSDPDFNQKAATDEEASTLAATLKDTDTAVRKTVRIEKMKAHLEREAGEYENLRLYAGAYVSGNEIILPREKRPGSAARIDISPSDRLSLSFEIFIPENFRGISEKDIFPGSCGKVISLRDKTLDGVKIKFFASGAVRAFSGSMWAPRLVDLGRVKFGEYNSVEIEYSSGAADITVNGTKAENVALSGGVIDNIFFESGMLPQSLFSVKNIMVNGADFAFKKADGRTETEKIGEVKLPFAVGTYENRDKAIVLEGEFNAIEADEAYLTVETLDPSGSVWLNGKVIFETESFDMIRINITDRLEKGKNTLKIKVDPRAPEVNYYWHRHTDCYDGWYAGGVKVEFMNSLHIDDIKVVTESVDGQVSASISTKINKSFSGTVKYTMRKIFPEEGKEVLIGCSYSNGTKNELKIEGNYDVWSPEEPNLYAVRASIIGSDGTVIDDYVTETGFRTVEQKDGGVFVNGKKTVFTGALLMQFLPPYHLTPVNHRCPTNEQFAWELLMLRAMNGNLLRLHMLGCGSNEDRLARLADRAGVMLVWTTRYIDSIEGMAHPGAWRERDGYIAQANAVINHPSIVMWEGSNEFHPTELSVVDRVYDEYVSAVRSFDSSRLICPVSHLYYGGGLYDSGCVYYNDAGDRDQDGNPAEASFGWRDGLVIRSSHPYSLLCGYGTSWETMRKQDWKNQPELFESKTHAYMSTEFAITSLENRETKEAIEKGFVSSYERGGDAGYIGRAFEESEWRESQALAALCAFNATKLSRMLGSDGLLWCCLSSGANDGSYMKPPIDFFGYKKGAFYALRSAYEKTFAAKEDINVQTGKDDLITPVILNSENSFTARVTVKIITEDGRVTYEKVYDNVDIKDTEFKKSLAPFKPEFSGRGYYTLSMTVEEA